MQPSQSWSKIPLCWGLNKQTKQDRSFSKELQVWKKRRDDCSQRATGCREIVLAWTGLGSEHISGHHCGIARQCDAKGAFCIVPMCLGYGKPKRIPQSDFPLGDMF